MSAFRRPDLPKEKKNRRSFPPHGAACLLGDVRHRSSQATNSFDGITLRRCLGVQIESFIM